MVGTNAFGMGVDKANVRWVIHYNLPSSMEACIQEMGRAGRDGLPSNCRILFSARDVNDINTKLNNEEVHNHECNALNDVRLFCLNIRKECRHYMILKHFEDKGLKGWKKPCSDCDTCRLQIATGVGRAGSRKKRKAA